jgi:small subunit ribosomal protein S11
MGKKRIITKSSNTDEAEKVSSSAKKAEKKGKSSKSLQKAIIFVNSTFNNTIIQLADESGNILATSSAGAIGFSGTKKSTPYAASKVAETLIEKSKK